MWFARQRCGTHPDVAQIRQSRPDYGVRLLKLASAFKKKSGGGRGDVSDLGGDVLLVLLLRVYGRLQLLRIGCGE